MILGQKVTAKRPSSSKVRVHNSDKARTGAEKISGLRFLVTEAHPPRQQLREGGRVKKRSPNDPARQGAPVDNRAAGTQLADHPMARQFSSLQDSFPILLTRISRDNEAGRFSMGQMKFTKLHISSRQPNRETYTGGFVVPLAGLRIKRVSATIRKNS